MLYTLDRFNRSTPPYPMTAAPTIVWFRRDLRVQDNPALAEALKRGGPIVAVYIYAPGEEGDWSPGGASRWWLHQALESLAGALAERGLALTLRQGPSGETLQALAEETGADSVFWNRRYEPVIIKRDTAIKSDLKAAGLEARSFNACLLWEPFEVQNKQGRPFRVFTPFWRHLQTLPVKAPEIGRAHV